MRRSAASSDHKVAAGAEGSLGDREEALGGLVTAHNGAVGPILSLERRRACLGRRECPHPPSTRGNQRRSYGVPASIPYGSLVYTTGTRQRPACSQRPQRRRHQLLEPNHVAIQPGCRAPYRRTRTCLHQRWSLIAKMKSSGCQLYQERLTAMVQDGRVE